jgi:hypothetical protein
MQDIMSAMPMTEGREFITLNGARVAARGPRAATGRSARPSSRSSSRWSGVFRAFHLLPSQNRKWPGKCPNGAIFRLPQSRPRA